MMIMSIHLNYMMIMMRWEGGEEAECDIIIMNNIIIMIMSSWSLNDINDDNHDNNM